MDFAFKTIDEMITPFIVMDVMERAAALERKGRRVLHLEVGQPSTGAPLTALIAAEAALKKDKLGYTSAVGLPEFRLAVSQHYRTVEGIDLDPRRIVATAGSSAGFVIGLLSSLKKGARVAIPTPGYPCYRNILISLGFEPVEVICEPLEGYQITVTALRDQTPAIDGIILANPANPTGVIAEHSNMDAVINYCRSEGIIVISDEIYNRIYYDNKPKTALYFSDDSIIVNSFSKYYSMTGWRIGWIVVPLKLSRIAEKLSQNLYIAPSTLSQIAAIAAFDADEELQCHIERYRTNRSIVVEGLKVSGIRNYAPPDGGFYVYADASPFTSNSLEFCKRLLSDVGVAITPGADFDRLNGAHMIRFSYSGLSADTREAMRLFSEFTSSYGEY